MEHEKVIFSCVIKYRWITIIPMRPISNHLIKMEHMHNHAYNSNTFSTWIMVVFPCRASFWLSILNLFFFHSFIEKFLFKPESRLCHDQVFYNKLLHNLTNGGHDLKQTMTSAGWRIVGYWPCKLSIWASGGYGRDIKNKDFKL